MIVLGLTEKDLDTALEAVAKSLGIEFERRDSDYHGGEYGLYRHKLKWSATVTVQANVDFDGRPFEAELKTPFLVIIDGFPEKHPVIAAADSAGWTRLVS
jgi:hypothetical protein